MEYLLPFVVVLYAVLSIVGGLKKAREKQGQDDSNRPSRRGTDESQMDLSRSDIRPNESEVERQIRLFHEQKERAMQVTSSAGAGRDSRASSGTRSSVKRKKTTAQPRSKSPVLPSATTTSTTNGVMETSASFAERVAHAAPPPLSSMPSSTSMSSLSTPSRLVVASDVAEMFRDRQSVARIFILNEILRRPW